MPVLLLLSMIVATLWHRMQALPARLAVPKFGGAIVRRAGAWSPMLAAIGFGPIGVGRSYGRCLAAQSCSWIVVTYPERGEAHHGRI